MCDFPLRWSPRSGVIRDPSVQADGLLAREPLADTCLLRDHEFVYVGISDFNTFKES
jgi:hypothetical protein